MVDNINGSNNNPKEWKKLGDTSKDKDYNQVLDKKINSILNGKETISLQQMKKNSLFSNLSEKALERFNYIAGIDGDNTTFNAEELKVLFALSDATLKDNQFVFDGKYSADNNSGLVEATDSEVEIMIQNLVTSNARTRTKPVDTSKYDRTKDFEEKINSSDVNEVMLGLSDKVSSGYIDKRTGESISILQAVIMFEDFKWTHDRDMSYEECQAAFKEETGIQIENFGRYRGMDGDRYQIGDWKYDIPEKLGEPQKQGVKVLLNEKTGEKIILSSTKRWYNSTNHTVPAANGYMFFLKEYKNNEGTSIKFNYGDEENMAPTSATVRTNGNISDIQYDPIFYIDPDLYNFRQNPMVKPRKNN